MSIEVFNRYETKFLMSTQAYKKLTEIINKYMEKDEYNRDNDFYTICNVYYDTDNNDLIRTSLEKPVYKEKLRLRSYGVPGKGSKVFLEIKKKYKGIVNKRRSNLTLSEAKALVCGHIYPEKKDYMNMQVIDELYSFVNLYNVSPKVYIAYDRLAYKGIEDSSLRITFDTNIRTRRYDVALEKGDYGTQLLDKDVWLMEVKCSGAMPMWLVSALSECGVYKTSFSKYGTEYKRYLNELLEVQYA
jgi:SPX domain protein involved in polyphosphate accumulation